MLALLSSSATAICIGIVVLAVCAVLAWIFFGGDHE